MSDDKNSKPAVRYFNIVDLIGIYIVGTEDEISHMDNYIDAQKVNTKQLIIKDIVERLMKYTQAKALLETDSKKLDVKKSVKYFNKILKNADKYCSIEFIEGFTYATYLDDVREWEEK